jgi:hypothetical protein
VIQAATLVTFLDLGSEYKVKKEISKIAFGRIDSSGGLKIVTEGLRKGIGECKAQEKLERIGLIL